MPDLKSMAVFFIDNKHLWPDGAVLLKNLVVWPDQGAYPTFTPIALAGHPCYDGKIAVMAGNRRIVVSLLAGAQTPEDIRAAMGKKPEQYCVAVDALVHSIMLMRNQTESISNEVHAITLMTILKGMPEGEVILKALRSYRQSFSSHTHRPTATEYQTVEELIDALRPTEDANPS